MARITQTPAVENEIPSTTGAFFHTFKIAALLKHAGACKMKGVPAAKLFRELLAFVFQN